MKKKDILEAVVILCASIISLILSILSFALEIDTIGDVILLTISGLLTGISIPYFFIVLINSKSQKEDRKEIDQYYENLRYNIRLKKNVEECANKQNKTSIKRNDTIKANILELMLANMKEIKEYYILSKSQSKKSFAIAIIMGMLGFMLIGVSIFISVLLKDNIAAMIIPAIGAVVVDLISAIFLVVYKKSVEQLNHYYSELHENEKFLSSINLVSSLSKEKQDEIYIEIIRSRLSKDK